VADEPKQPWYKSIPGILTAATGFIAALSGLVAGLNQLGAFRREPPAAVVGSPPTPADHTAQDSLSSGARHGNDSAALRSTTSPATAPGPTLPTAAPPRPAAGTSPSPARKPARPTSTTDTAKTGPLMVPKGTTLSLTVPTRTCAPADGARPLTARLAAPVQLNGATVIPAGATAVLRLRRAGDPPEPRARLDSLVRSGQALLVTSAQVQIPRASASGACIRAGGQLTVVLGEAVLVPRS
jgi:hypothetical protein